MDSYYLFCYPQKKDEFVRAAVISGEAERKWMVVPINDVLKGPSKPRDGGTGPSYLFA